MNVLPRLLESLLYSLLMLASPGSWVPALLVVWILRWGLDTYAVPWIGTLSIVVALSWLYFGIDYLVNPEIIRNRRPSTR